MGSWSLGPQAPADTHGASWEQSCPPSPGWAQGYGPQLSPIKPPTPTPGATRASWLGEGDTGPSVDTNEENPAAKRERILQLRAQGREAELRNAPASALAPDRKP